jgi:hypothetical protein
MADHLVEAQYLIAINDFDARGDAFDGLVGEQPGGATGGDRGGEAEALERWEALADP